MTGGAKYRYPGPQEFEDTPADKRRFFGRTQEISTVAERIVASRLLVVYGGSGLGKSSLLKAGVFPKLRDENLLPVRVRLNKPGGSVLELLKDACAAAARDTSHEFEIDYTPGAGQTAWEFFRTVMFWRGERLVPPILVFDQFEEIFTLADAAWRKEFGLEIGPLASGNVPSSVRERLRSGESGLSDQAPNVKLVFCLKEEYYGSLQDLSPQFPGLFQDRFRLRPLDANQAELAIVEPARLESSDSSAESFVTPAFEYERDAIKHERDAIKSMVGFLQDRSQSIEPVPLQLLCQYVEQVIVEGKRKAETQSPIVITANDLGGESVMNKVIGRFYQDSIDGLPAAERRHARELCDTGLLGAAGNRLPLEKNQIVKDYQVSEDTLRYLTDVRHILRQEPRLESTFYEISHDTIARSIFESRKWRLPKQWRRAAAVSAVFMIALLAFAGWAWVERYNAKVSATNAENSEKRAKKSLEASETIVAFLMGEDFLAKLRPMGRLNVFEAMQTRVPCEPPKQGVEYSDVGLNNLGLACLNEGDIDHTQLRLSEAAKQYERAHLIFTELKRRKFNGSDKYLAESLSHLADVAEDQLDLDRSLKLTLQSLDIQEPLVAGGSNDDKLLRDLAESYLSMGSIKEKQGYLRDALANFEKAVALSQEKDSAEWLYIQQDGLIGESDVFAWQGDSARSEESAKKAYECAKKTVEKNPFAPKARYRLGVALSRLPASANPKPGDLSRDLLENVASAAAWDPENNEWASDWAVTLTLRGDALVQDKQWDKAAKQYQAAIPKMQKLLQIDGTNLQRKADLLVRVHESLGAAYSQQDPATRGRFQAAMKSGAATGEGEAGSSKVAPSQQNPAILGKFQVTLKPGAVTGKEESGSSKVAPSQPESEVIIVKSKDALGEYRTAQELVENLEKDAPRDREIRYTAARLALSAARLQSSEEAIKTCDRALRELEPPPDPTDSYYWEYKHQLETELGDALKSEGDRAKAGKAFQAAATSIDWRLRHFPPNADEWYDKFLLFYYHIAPFRQSEKDATGELAAYQEALRAFEKAALLRPKKVAQLDEMALAQQHVGDAFRDSGKFDQAQEHYTAAEKAWRNALQLSEGKDSKQSADYQNRLFLLFYDHVAGLRTQQKDDDAVRKAYQDSLAPIMKAAELAPTDPVYQDNLALAQQRVGDSFRDSAKFDQAQEHYDAAENAWQNALQLNRNKNINESASYQNRLFLLFYDHVATLRRQQKDNAAVRKAYQASLAPIVKAAELAPTEPVYQNNLALAQAQVGDSFRDTGKFAQAQEHYAAAEKAWRNALHLKESAEYQNGLFLLFNDHVAELREKQKDEAGQLKTYQDALDAERKAVALAPKEGDYRVSEALALWNIGKLQSDNRQALETFRLAVETLREGVALFPKGEANLATRANAQTGFYVILHNHIAPILHNRNDASGEFSALSEALAGAQAAVDLEKGNPAYQANLGEAHLGIGDFQLQRRADQTRALESYVKAEQAFRVAAKLNPNEAAYWSSLAAACSRRGLIQEDKGDSLAARTSYQNALNAIEQAGKLNPDASTKQLRDEVLKKLEPKE